MEAAQAASDEDTGEGLVCAYLLDGRGGGRQIGWDEVRRRRPEDGLLWVHLDRRMDDARGYIRAHREIEPVLVEALIGEESRPRVTPQGEHLMVLLRGVNLNPGADPEDMVSIRIWISRGLIITLRHRRLRAVDALRQEIAAGRGPCNEGDFLVMLVGGMIERMGPVIEDLEEEVDGLENRVLLEDTPNLKGRLGELRHTVIALRRYLSPQRDAMVKLVAEPVPWLQDSARDNLRELANRTVHIVEELDSVRERATVVQEEIATRLAERMNRTMYVLTVVAAVLLPASLVAGLLGMNVGGLPGADEPLAFAVTIGVMVLLGVAEVIVMRWMKLI